MIANIYVIHTFKHLIYIKHTREKFTSMVKMKTVCFDFSNIKLEKSKKILHKSHKFNKSFKKTFDCFQYGCLCLTETRHMQRKKNTLKKKSFLRRRSYSI